MYEEKENKRKGVQRHQVVASCYCTLLLISSGDLAWSEHFATIIDRSVIGIGVETNEQLVPGFVWFKESVYSQACGYLVWSRQTGSLYRSGIQFIDLTRDQEQYLRLQVDHLKPHHPMHDPDRVVQNLIEHL